jgi:hypothetical protein
MEPPSAIPPTTKRVRATTIPRRKSQKKPKTPSPSADTAFRPGTAVTHRQIEELAYFIYIKQGCPEGRQLEHWLMAESQLRQAE